MTEDGHGSGVLISANTILTSAHVVRSTLSPKEGEKPTPIAVEFSNKETLMASVVWIGSNNGENDIALLKLEKPTTISPARLSCRTPSLGESLYSVGNPLLNKWVLLSIKVASEREIMPEISTTTLIQGPFLPGNSGGPVFDHSGNVVGLVQLLENLPQPANPYPLVIPTGLGGFLPVASLCEALPSVSQ